MAFAIVGDAAIITGSTNPSKPAAVFTGGNTDDYYQVDALAAARTAANDTAGTIVAWINTGDKTSTGTILGFGDKNVVEFIEFNIEAGKLACRCTDATVAQFVGVTDSIVIQPHYWTHVAVVQAADGVGPKFYVNGVKVASTNSTATDLSEWFNNCDGIDSGRIGAANKAGDDSVTQEFVGAITGLKYYNTALTEAQIFSDFKGGHLTTGCIAWYEMNDLLDSATGAGTYSMTAVSDVYLTPTYNEFISRVRKFGAVTADVGGFSAESERMTVLFINAA